MPRITARRPTAFKSTVSVHRRLAAVDSNSAHSSACSLSVPNPPRPFRRPQLLAIPTSLGPSASTPRRTQAPQRLFDEHTHFFALAVGRLPQKHLAKAIVRVLAIGVEVTRTVEFS